MSPLDPLLSSPYVQMMRVHFDGHGDELTAILPYADTLVGNPLIPALHGGAIGAFMEITASAALLAGTRLGARVANVRVEAWQDRRAAPVAALHGHFLIKPEGES